MWELHEPWNSTEIRDGILNERSGECSGLFARSVGQPSIESVGVVCDRQLLSQECAAPSHISTTSAVMAVTRGPRRHCGNEAAVKTKQRSFNVSHRFILI